MEVLARTRNWFHALKNSIFRNLSKITLENAGEISYRKATFQDISKLLDVERDVFEEVPWAYNHFKYEISDNRKAIFIIAEKKDLILGYIGLRWSWELNELHISNFVVKKGAQNHGIGSQLLLDAEEIARDLKVSKLSLEVRRDNQSARVFYKKRNFENRETMKNYYNDGADAILMIKILSPFIKNQELKKQNENG